MVQETKRFLSYICPRCMQSVIVERDLFSLAAAPAHVRCPCGKSELAVEFKPSRVELTVPCLFCGREHTVSCSSHAFVREKALAFSCAAWSMIMWNLLRKPEQNISGSISTSAYSEMFIGKGSADSRALWPANRKRSFRCFLTFTAVTQNSTI